jgi:hypothetical protein
MTATESLNGLSFPSARRQVRLLVLLDAAQQAGLSPINVLRLHAFAYLSNVLAPVWDLRALDGKILKRRGGPFYPALQRDLDRLVGMGLAEISNLGHVKDDYGRWRLEGSYQLHREFADAPLALLAEYEEERFLTSFVVELGYALSALSDEEMDQVFTEDATYSDPTIGFENVVDFGEWHRINYSANAADEFEKLMPSGARATLGERLHLYVRHLHRRIHGGR